MMGKGNSLTDHKRNWAIWRTRALTDLTIREIAIVHNATESVTAKAIHDAKWEVLKALDRGWELPIAEHTRDGLLGLTFTFTLGKRGFKVSEEDGE